ELLLQRLPAKPLRSCPNPDVRRLGPLRLHADEMLDDRRRREAHALQQQLPRQRGAVQFAKREDPFAPCHSRGAAMLTSQRTPNRSVHIPNVSPHAAFSSGISTEPSSDIFSK